MRPDLVRDAGLIEQAAQIIILISLFSAGLKLRPSPRGRLWLLSFRLAFVSMTITVAHLAGQGEPVGGGRRSARGTAVPRGVVLASSGSAPVRA